MSQRYDQLDSLRGIAALTVILGHLTGIGFGEIGQFKAWHYLNLSPLAILWSAHQAVIFFFMLSGFVLALPYLKDTKPLYQQFIVKRVLRIYTPMIVAIAIGILIRDVFTWNAVIDFRRSWEAPLSLGLVLEHIFLLGSFNYDSIDPVIWSLTQEMRISIIFPIIMLFVNRFNWKTSIIVGFALSCAGIVLNYLFHHYTTFYQGYYLNYFDTIHYVMMFVVGAVLAKYKDNLIVLFRGLSTILKSLVFVFGIVAYTYSTDIHLPGWTEDWPTTIGAAIFIVIALSSLTSQRFLMIKPIWFSGRISYSVYLYHLIVLFTLVNLMYGRFPSWMIWVGTIGIAILIATISYYLVERPSIRIGRFLAGKAKGTSSASEVPA